MAAHLLAACSSTHVSGVVVEAEALPTPLVERIPLTIGVHFDKNFITAKPETSYVISGETYIWRHFLGEASRANFLQSLSGVFTSVAELEQAPTSENPTPGIAAVLVPSAPAMRSTLDINSSLTHYSQEINFPLALFSPQADLLAEWTVSGVAADGFHQQNTLDRAMLRSAAAALIKSWQDGPPREALHTVSTFKLSPPTSDLGEVRKLRIVAVRLDAGLPLHDRFEQQIAECMDDDSANAAQPSLDSAQLRDAAFPWFDPGSAPRRDSEIEAVLGNPLVRDRLHRLGLSHLMLFTVREGDPIETDKLFCAGGFNAGACLGHYQKTTRQLLDVQIWKIKPASPLASRQFETSRSLGVVGALFPLPYMSSNHGEFCTAIRHFLNTVLTP